MIVDGDIVVYGCVGVKFVVDVLFFWCMNFLFCEDGV